MTVPAEAIAGRGLQESARADRTAPRSPVIRRLLRRPSAALGLVVIVGFAVVALGASVIAPYDPIATSFSTVRKAPSIAHWFGTDEIGRDVLSRVVFGARASLLAGVVSVLFTSDRRVFFGHEDDSIRVASCWERDEVLIQMMVWRDRFPTEPAPSAWCPSNS